MIDFLDNVSIKVVGRKMKMNGIQHYDPSSSCMLGMPFIMYVLTFTITVDKVISNIKNKAVYVQRFSVAKTNVENKYAEIKKKGVKRKPENDSKDWKNVLQVYEDR
jgi:hypothetical protein